MAKRTQKPEQQELGFGLGLHGGRREGAGRHPGPRPLVWHRSREKFPATNPLHVTLKVRRGLPSLRQWKVVRAVESTFRRGRVRDGFRLVHYSIQDDHAHVIVEANGPEALGRGMKSLAARFARAVNRGLGRTGKVLADRYHLQILTCPRQVRNVLAYVLLNARRHAAKRLARLGRKAKPLPRQGVLDAASSARWFDGWRDDLDHALDRSPPRALGRAPAVVEPTVWLLLEGWRRHGLLDPNEIPGGLRG
ncbi:MAG TPA: hypothetical protein VNE71_12765 [Myxococcota bacterium]|nr:hypothetical protein [Myxococcota bacterium]